ncbi:MAG: hypothetical protein SO170_09940 [Butyribacter sp.]|nr:hypothetical protein [bacterium]MDY3855256.1 hypothetical protein [Butyribacter sp.]
MKKNIFSVIITALTVINVVLTAVMFFVMLPTFQKTNTLITQVAAVLNLDLDADEAAAGDAEVKMSDKSPVTVSWESQQTYNLKAGTDNKEHYAMLKGYTLYLNKNADDFEEINELLTADQAQITGLISNVIQSHTKEEATQALIEKEALEEIQKSLDSKVAVQIVLDGFVTQ